MEDLFVPQKIEILAKENGYIKEDSKLDEPIRYEELKKWFKDTHNTHINVQWREFAVKHCDGYYYDFNETDKKPQDYIKGSNTYYGTMNIAITKAFELIKK